MNARSRNQVGTYRGVGTFRKQAASRSGRAAQDTPLPPRCSECRLPGIHIVDDERYCDDHVKNYI